MSLNLHKGCSRITKGELLIIGSEGNLRKQIFEELHEKGVRGHFEARATLSRVEQ